MSELKQFCTFYAGGLFFGVNVLKVQEVLTEQDMTAVPLASDEVCGLINLRGQIVTAIDLRRRLGIESNSEKAPTMNVVVNTKEGVFSLLVDEIDDVIEPDDSTYESPPQTLSGAAKKLVTGVYKLEGRLLLILDTEAAVSLEDTGNLSQVPSLTIKAMDTETKSSAAKSPESTKAEAMRAEATETTVGV